MPSPPRPEPTPAASVEDAPDAHASSLADDARGSPGRPTRASRLARAVATTAVAALALYAVGAAWSDVRALRAVLGAFPFALLPLVALLTLGNYALRLGRWHLYLRLVGATLAPSDTARAFLVGLPLVATPAKVGELLKAWVVKQLDGTPMAATMPTVLVERLVDGLAMLALAGVGLGGLEDRRLRAMALAVLAALLAAVLLVQLRPLALTLLDLAGRLPLVGRHAGAARAFYESSHALLRPRPFLGALAVGILSWGLEGLAYALVLVGVGAPPTLETALGAVFIFSLASVAGAVIGTPGGLGGVEGVLVLLSTSLVGLDRPAAVAAALLIRLMTLWFAVGLGLVAIARWPALLWGEGAPQPAADKGSNESPPWRA